MTPHALHAALGGLHPHKEIFLDLQQLLRDDGEHLNQEGDLLLEVALEVVLLDLVGHKI